MSNRPTNTPIWTDGDPAKQVEPSSGLKNTGWQYKDKPPFEYINWLFYNIYNFIKWLIGGYAYIKQVASANYTILDDDNYSVILVTTGSSDRTITLPAINTNKSRKIKIKKVDDGLGNVIISRAGSDTIESTTSITLTKKHDTLEIANDETSDWKIVFTNILNSSKDSITAYASGGQANATQLNNSVNRITTCATIGDSVKLPGVFKAGDRIIVINDGAAACDIYPASGDTIDNHAADAPFRAGVSSRITLVATTDSSAWRVVNVQNELITPSITAFAGGGQANATQLYRGVNYITVCATRLDSVKLPSSFNVGDTVIVTNNGAKTANIYPASGDNINSLAANTAVKLLPGNTMIFQGTTANSKWETLSNQKQVSPEIDVSSLLVTDSGTVSSSFAKVKISLDSDGVERLEDGYMTVTFSTSRADAKLGITGITSPALNQPFSGNSASGTATDTYSLFVGGTYQFQILQSAGSTDYNYNVDNLRLASQTLI